MAFLDSTRQNIRPLSDTLTFSEQGRSVARFPRVGLLARLYINVSGTMTITPGTGDATLSSKGPWNLINQLRVTANQGMEIIRLNGFTAHILDEISAGKPYEAADGQVSAGFASDVYSAGVSSGANDWNFTIVVNITPNERDLAGLLLLQTDQMAAELDITWGRAGGASIDNPVVLTGDATASFDGSATVHTETFTVPGDPADAPDLTTVFQQLERTDPVGSIGENRINLLRANLYSRILHVTELNGALDSDNIDRLQLRYNNADTPYTIDRDAFQLLQRRRYGHDLPTGVWVWDMFYQGVPGFGGTRDLINAGTVAEFSSLLDVGSSATLGSGNNYIRTATQQFVTLNGGQR